MGKPARKTSLTAKITAASLAITLLALLVLSTVFIVTARNIMKQQITSRTTENIHALRDRLLAHFNEWNGLITLTAIAASHFITPEGIDSESLQNLFVRNMETQLEVIDMYATSSTLWDGPGGFAVFGGGWIPPQTRWINTDRPWFLAAKANPELVGYTEPYICADTGSLVITIAKVIRDRFDREIGVAGIDVDIAFLNGLLKEKPFMPGQDIFLMNKQGLLIAHPGTAALENNFFDEFNFAHYRSAVLSPEPFASYGRDFFVYSELIPDLDWILVSIIPTASVFAEANQFALRMVFMGIALLAAAAIASVAFTHKRLTIPIRRIRDEAGSLSNMDFSVSIKISENNEIGEMQRAMVKIRDNLKSNFALFSENASKVSRAVHDLSSSAREITATANEQSATVSEIVSTMECSRNLSEQAAVKTTEVAELAAQTEHLSQHGAELHGANEGMMADIRAQNKKVVNEISGLTDVLSRICESVQFIDSIADRTKLIAFNAALEASSAGEAGHRFAVVAGEIRRFADNVVESVAEIKDRVFELQEASSALISEAGISSHAIDSGYNRMLEQKEVFGSIVDVSQSVAIRSQQISNLSRQQELASEQVFTALKEISAGVQQFVSATASTSTAADSLNDMARELREALVQYNVANGEPYDN